MSALPIHWLVIHPNLLFQAEPSNLPKYSKIKSDSLPLDNLLNTDSRKQRQDKKKICTSDMKKANYKKYMQPLSYQQPGSPNTEDIMSTWPRKFLAFPVTSWTCYSLCHHFVAQIREMCCLPVPSKQGEIPSLSVKAARF